MRSLILQASVKLILILQMILSLFLLWRGHHLPGGGFTGGLVAASAFILYSIAFDVKKTKSLLRISPEKVMAFGLLISLGSGLFSVFQGHEYMKGVWKGPFGTPILFDVGVYLVVFGMTLTMAFGLFERVIREIESEDP